MYIAIRSRLFCLRLQHVCITRDEADVTDSIWLKIASTKIMLIARVAIFMVFLKSFNVQPKKTFNIVIVHSTFHQVINVTRRHRHVCYEALAKTKLSLLQIFFPLLQLFGKMIQLESRKHCHAFPANLNPFLGI